MKREPEARVSTEGFFCSFPLAWLASAGNLSFHTSQNDTKRSDETLTARHVSEPLFFSSCTFRPLEAQPPAQNDHPSLRHARSVPLGTDRATLDGPRAGSVCFARRGLHVHSLFFAIGSFRGVTHILKVSQSSQSLLFLRPVIFTTVDSAHITVSQRSGALPQHSERSGWTPNRSRNGAWEGSG